MHICNICKTFLKATSQAVVLNFSSDSEFHSRSVTFSHFKLNSNRTQSSYDTFVLVLKSTSGTYKQQCECSSQALTFLSARLPSPCTVSSWILEADWRLPVCNTLPFLSEIALQRFPDKTATQKGNALCTDIYSILITLNNLFTKPKQLFLYRVHRVLSHL